MPKILLFAESPGNGQVNAGDTAPELVAAVPMTGADAAAGAGAAASLLNSQ